MSNEFKKFIREGKSRIFELQDKVNELSSVISSLSNALTDEDHDIELSVNDTHGGYGYAVSISVKGFSKKLFTVNIQSEDTNEAGFIRLNYMNDIFILDNKDELIEVLGNEISSLSFWKMISEIKKVADDEIPF